MTMTTAEKRRQLRAAGWRTNMHECHSGEKRPPERWYQADSPGTRYTLGAAYKRLTATA